MPNKHLGEKMKIKIPFKFGSIEVEAETKEKLEQAIEVAMRSLKDMNASEEFRSSIESQNYLAHRMKLTEGSIIEMLRNLIKNQYFRSPKSMRDIKNELVRLGWHPRTSSLSPALMRAVRRGELDRERDKGRNLWVYYVSHHKILRSR